MSRDLAWDGRCAQSRRGAYSERRISSTKCPRRSERGSSLRLTAHRRNFGAIRTDENRRNVCFNPTLSFLLARRCRCQAPIPNSGGDGIKPHPVLKRGTDRYCRAVWDGMVASVSPLTDSMTARMTDSAVAPRGDAPASIFRDHLDELEREGLSSGWTADQQDTELNRGPLAVPGTVCRRMSARFLFTDVVDSKGRVRNSGGGGRTCGSTWIMLWHGKRWKTSGAAWERCHRPSDCAISLNAAACQEVGITGHALKQPGGGSQSSGSI